MPRGCERQRWPANRLRSRAVIPLQPSPMGRFSAHRCSLSRTDSKSKQLLRTCSHVGTSGRRSIPASRTVPASKRPRVLRDLCQLRRFRVQFSFETCQVSADLTGLSRQDQLFGSPLPTVAVATNRTDSSEPFDERTGHQYRPNGKKNQPGPQVWDPCHSHPLFVRAGVTIEAASEVPPAHRQKTACQQVQR